MNKGEKDMYYKVSPIIIAVLIVVVLCVVGLGVKFLLDNKNNTGDDQTEVVPSEIVPVLKLTSNTDEENQESVTLTAIATTDDEAGIQAITLPDGSVNRSDNATFTVTENGNYTFRAKGNNGQTTSLAIEVNNIREASANSPYMPTGFSHKGGEVDSGYVIEDSYGNQFVWVPVPSGKLTRNTMQDTDYEESNSTASALVNSVAQNYGFYMGRYEASTYEVNGEIVAGSMGGKQPRVNISYIEAAAAASKAAQAFGYEGYQTAILNSYAWDTTTTWLDQTSENYSTSTNSGNYSGNIRETGQTEADIKNNICDLAGNVREWTTEIYKFKPATTNTSSKNKNKNKNNTNTEVVSETVNYRVVRGGSANLSRTASSHTGYKENASDPSWGFRMILYK